MKPADLKKIAQKFTEKYYPQYVLRVDRIWDMFEKVDPNLIPSESTKSEYRQGDALAIIGTTDPQFKECISGIAILAFTYQDLKNENNIDKNEIIKKISIVPASFEITPKIKEKLEDVLGEMLPQIVERVVESKEKLNIAETVPINKLEIDKTYFTKNYDIKFYSERKGQKGKLRINKSKTINLSAIEHDICLQLYSTLDKTWNILAPKDIGWVSYDDFRESVTLWKMKEQQHRDDNAQDVVVADEIIRKAINRINIKIRNVLGKDKSYDLIENGKEFLKMKCFRFRVHKGFIDLVD